MEWKYYLHFLMFDWVPFSPLMFLECIWLTLICYLSPEWIYKMLNGGTRGKPCKICLILRLPPSLQYQDHHYIAPHHHTWIDSRGRKLILTNFRELIMIEDTTFFMPLPLPTRPPPCIAYHVTTIIDTPNSDTEREKESHILPNLSQSNNNTRVEGENTIWPYIECTMSACEDSQKHCKW